MSVQHQREHQRDNNKGHDRQADFCGYFQHDSRAPCALIAAST